MPDDVLLAVEGLRSGYGASPVLLGVDLDVGRGEVVAVIGRNGVGKTTLMRTLCGLLAPTAGRISFGGRDVTAEAADRRARGGLAYIPQGRDVFPTLTVRENLLVAEAARTSPARPDYAEIYRSFPVLKERDRQSAGTLSGGQQQQLAIARAMIGEPTMMLLDEPSEGIQPSIVQEISGHIRRLNTETGLTVLFVEQNLDLIVSLADRGIVMDKGHIVARLDGADIKSRDVVKRFLAL
ncbi:MAG: ABC transporter ATP-binding protein [Rhodobacteraceae bacterium]|nr:ABC transporter ATP-binding protein [Paracoccaceae bacterium]